MVAVNTPSLPDGGADLSQVQSAVGEAATKMEGPGTLIMKSSVPPGTGNDLVNRFLKDSTVTYVSNPEFLRTGQSVEDWYASSRIVIGTGDVAAVKTMRRLYHDIKAPWVITDINSAEMIKYASNSFLATKVSFINEVANLCERVDANIDDVITGMGLDPRIGPAYLQPGAGYGGLCLPKDTLALEFLASSKGYEFKTLRAVIEANTRQRTVIVDKLKQVLATLKGMDVTVLGLAFKPGTDDISNAPAIDIVEILIGAGSRVRVYDPAAMENAGSVLPDSIVYATDFHAAVSGAKAIVLLTEWPEFINADWGKIIKDMQEPYIFIDGRNALPPGKLRHAGFKYMSIGRNPEGKMNII